MPKGIPKGTHFQYTELYIQDEMWDWKEEFRSRIYIFIWGFPIAKEDGAIWIGETIQNKMDKEEEWAYHKDPQPPNPALSEKW